MRCVSEFLSHVSKAMPIQENVRTIFFYIFSSMEEQDPRRWTQNGWDSHIVVVDVLFLMD